MSNDARLSFRHSPLPSFLPLRRMFSKCPMYNRELFCVPYNNVTISVQAGQ